MLKSISSEKYRNLLKWLKDARCNQDLSMRDLGSLLNLPHSFVGKIETGERRLDVYEYVQYCQVLGISTEEGLEILKDKNVSKNTPT